MAVEAADVIPWVLYPWLAISLGIYGYRGYRRFFAPKKTEPQAERTKRPTKVAKATSRDLGTDLNVNLDLPTGRPGSLVESVIREELEARKRQPSSDNDDAGTGAVAGRAGLFSPASSRNETGETPNLPVAELLAGIELPCGLTPLIGIDPDAFDEYRVAFITTDATAPIVGEKIGDELERLGFAIRTESETTAIATKGGIDLRITIVPDANLAMQDNSRRFPTATSGSVAIEFST